MKYFLDTEFHEGFHKPLFGKNRHFIDLISIGIISEDNRTYSAISKDFDIDAAWNSWQPQKGDRSNQDPKEYWLRENVLRPIFDELLMKDEPMLYHAESIYCFKLSRFKELIKKYGKSNSQIAEEIKFFVYPSISDCSDAAGVSSIDAGLKILLDKNPISFYTYYGDYDWVLFCSLYGKMINLPKFFPKYSRDLKQMFDELQEKNSQNLKELETYPKQSNTEHNALNDAIWNKDLYNFIKTYINNER